MFERSTPTPSLLLHARVPAGPRWQPIGTKGFSYKTSTDGTPDGVQRVRVQSGAKSKVTLSAGGASLATPVLPLALPLTLQLQAGHAGCFEARYSSAGLGRNDATKAQLRADP